MPLPWTRAFAGLLERATLVQPDELPAAVSASLLPLGIRSTMYTIDEQQQALHALPEPGRPVPPSLAVDGTLAGRAFSTMQAVVGPARPGSVGRLWLPLLDANERLGVLELAAADVTLLVDDVAFQDQCRRYAHLVGHLFAAKMPYGDGLVRMRRTARMSAGSELVRALLPPMTLLCTRAVVSAILEPCYTLGGDGYDYAVDGSRLYLAVFDTAGHELRAGLGTAAVLAATRAARRGGDDLDAVAVAADLALAEHLPELRFTTAVLADLHLGTGLVRYLNAGHPPPLVVRGGAVVRRLDQGRRMPLGVADPQARVADVLLEPGDRLLVFTDGFIDAPDERGVPFGEQRLIDLVEQHCAAGLPAPETLRRLCRAALSHLDGPPRDDATLVLVEWGGHAPR